MTKKSNQHGNYPCVRPCGCVWYVGSDPTFPCRDAAALLASYRFAEMLAAAMPADWLCSRLLEVTRTALDRHYGRSPALALTSGASPPGVVDASSEEPRPARTLRYACGRRPRADDDGALWPLACAGSGISSSRAAPRSRPQAVVAPVCQP